MIGRPFDHIDAGADTPITESALRKMVRIAQQRQSLASERGLSSVTTRWLW